MATWEDRLRPAAYTSPSGKRIRFDFEDVSRETPLRNTHFGFPGINNDYVQQNGFGSRSYPLRCIFWGAQYDLIAAAFEAALLEKGIGRLEHPVYGTIDVVPDGTITRRDDLKSAANQAIVEVTFATTTGIVYPDATADAANEILAMIAGFDVAAAQQFANRTNLKTAALRASMKGGIRGALAQISKALSGVSSGVTAINRQFRNVQSTVNYGLDVLVGQPLLLAQQVSSLIKAPGRALTGIGSRLDGYGDLADEVFGSPGGRPLHRLANATGLATARYPILNDFHASDLVVSNSVSGSIYATAAAPIGTDGREKPNESQFSTRPQAINAASSILGQFDNWAAWREECFAGFGSLLSGIDPSQLDTGEAYQQLQDAAALCAGYLIKLSFTLKPEHVVYLDRPRTIIDLCSELYRSVDDDRLDFLINTNDLTGDDILELPRGKRIVYYA